MRSDEHAMGDREDVTGAVDPFPTTSSDQPAGGVAIERAIRSANSAGQPALAAFVTAGFPDRGAFPSLLSSVASAAHVVEVGVPFTDPMADGLTIQHASRVALAGGASLSWILQVLERTAVATPVVLMSYLNPLLAYGFEHLATAAVRAGVAGVIVPDLPLEESAPLARMLGSRGVALVPLVTPVTPHERLRRLCESGQGFVYAVTSTGTTGGSVRVSHVTLDYLDGVRAASARPVLAGFGIRTADELDLLADHVDGVIVGSALIEAIGRGDDAGDFLRGLHPSSRRQDTPQTTDNPRVSDADVQAAPTSDRATGRRALAGGKEHRS